MCTHTIDSISRHVSSTCPDMKLKLFTLVLASVNILPYLCTVDSSNLVNPKKIGFVLNLNLSSFMY